MGKLLMLLLSRPDSYSVVSVRVVDGQCSHMLDGGLRLTLSWRKSTIPALPQFWMADHPETLSTCLLPCSERQ